jgi:hypothetical protein
MFLKFERKLFSVRSAGRMAIAQIKEEETESVSEIRRGKERAHSTSSTLHWYDPPESVMHSLDLSLFENRVPG